MPLKSDVRALDPYTSTRLETCEHSEQCLSFLFDGKELLRNDVVRSAIKTRFLDQRLASIDDTAKDAICADQDDPLGILCCLDLCEGKPQLVCINAIILS